MKSMAPMCLLAAAFAAPVSTHVSAQGRGAPRLESTLEFVAGDPAIGPVVRGAPYSGEATTTVLQVLADGTRIERTTVVRIYRDGEGRVRREQTLLGLGALSATGDAPSIVTITDPVAGTSYALDPNARTARRSSGSVVMRTADGGYVNFRVGERGAESRVGEPPPPPPPPPPPGTRRARGNGVIPNMPQLLGTRQIEGLTAVGAKYSETIPVDRIGNDRPIEITDERWESKDLQVLLLSHHHDPRTGDVDYRLTNISRAEPPRDLFVVPPDYTVLQARDQR